MGSDSDNKNNKPVNTNSKTLTEQIEVFYEEPIPEELAEHLEHFFKELNFSPYPNFDLSNPEEAKKASAHATETLKLLQNKISQVKALEHALKTANIKDNSN